MTPTISYAAEWTHLQPREVHYVTCPDCGSLRRVGPGPHAPRWLGGRQVDCAGREVTP